MSRTISIVGAVPGFGERSASVLAAPSRRSSSRVCVVVVGRDFRRGGSGNRCAARRTTPRGGGTGGSTPSWCATGQRENPQPSRIEPSCAPIRIRSSREWPSPPSRSAPGGPSSRSRSASSPRSSAWPPPSTSPTVVNNVETLATATQVLARGPEWHRSLGTAESPGCVVATVVGDVLRPDVGEVEMGTPLGEVIDRVGGGVRPGRRVKAVLSGVANPVLTADQLDTPCSYEGMKAAGSGLGAAGFLVLDDTASMVEVAQMVSRFLYVESCGQCPACKLGCGAVTEDLDRLAGGRATPDDLDTIAFRLQTCTDGNRCYLPVQEQQVVASILQAFPDEVAAALGGEPLPARGLQVPKLVDLGAGRAILDERQARKRPDWTYEAE